MAAGRAKVRKDVLLNLVWRFYHAFQALVSDPYWNSIRLVQSTRPAGWRTAHADVLTDRCDSQSRGA